MSVTEIVGPENLEYGPPQSMSVSEWNNQRRQEIASRRRTRNHRTLVDQVGGCGKVRAAETSRSND
jgi:hypothetical protein